MILKQNKIQVLQGKIITWVTASVIEKNGDFKLHRENNVNAKQ